MNDEETKPVEETSDEEGSPAAAVKPAEHPTIEEHAKRLQTPAYALAGAKVLHKWGRGRRMAEADFKAGIEKWGAVPLGGDGKSPKTTEGEEPAKEPAK